LTVLVTARYPGISAEQACSDAGGEGQLKSGGDVLREKQASITIGKGANNVKSN